MGVEVHPAERGDTKPLGDTLDTAKPNLERVGREPGRSAPAELVADKGYHSRAVLKALDGGPGETRIAEPKRNGLH